LILWLFGARRVRNGKVVVWTRRRVVLSRISEIILGGDKRTLDERRRVEMGGWLRIKGPVSIIRALCGFVSISVVVSMFTFFTVTRKSVVEVGIFFMFEKTIIIHVIGN